MNRIIRRIIAVMPAVILQALWFFVMLRWLAPYAALISYLMTFAAVIFVLYIISSHSEGTYKTLWLLVIIGLPVTGAVLYLLFGNKRTARPLRKKLEKADRNRREMLNELFSESISGTGTVSGIASEESNEASGYGDKSLKAVNSENSSKADNSKKSTDSLSFLNNAFREVDGRERTVQALCFLGMNRRLAQTFGAVQNKTGAYPAFCDNVQYFPLGELMWDRMLKDLEQAEQFIFAEYFIIEEGKMWDSMVEIMARKASRGVDVRVMYDDLGSISTYSSENVAALRKKGIKCVAFNPLKSVKGTVNYRDHRKMLVIDGCIAYSGGINLADEYINRKEKYGHWKDIGFRLTGLPVHSFTGMFAEFWDAFSGEPIPKKMVRAYFEQRQAGLADMDEPNEGGRESYSYEGTRGIALSYYDSPIREEEVSNNLYIDLLSQAEKYAWFYTPYLMPGDFLLDAFVKAAERGVDVRIIMPGIPDKKVVYRMSRSYYYPLIKAGVRIYEYTPGFVHAKGCIIDDELCTIGTVNLDYRSLFLHFENNTVFWNVPIIEDVKADFLITQEKSRERTMENIDTGFVKWLIDGLLRIFAPLC